VRTSVRDLQGSAATRYRRAIETQSIVLAELAAREMGHVPLGDALALVMLYATAGSHKRSPQPPLTCQSSSKSRCESVPSPFIVSLSACDPCSPVSSDPPTETTLADADPLGFDAVLDRAVAIDRPPPRRTRVRSTTYAALANIASGNYFDRGAGRRIVVLLTDGESIPVDSGEIARALGRGRGYRLLAVRFWRSGEAVFGSNRKREAAYRPDPGGRATVAGVAAATGGRAFEQDQLGAASGYLVHLAGRGPTRPAAVHEQSRTPLAAYVAVAALLLLVASLWAGRANRGSLVRSQHAPPLLRRIGVCGSRFRSRQPLKRLLFWFRA
jgi:hypothetical protein